MCQSMVDIQPAAAEIWRGKKETRMWANAQRDARPVPNTGGALCSAPQSLADAHYWSAVQ